MEKAGLDIGQVEDDLKEIRDQEGIYNKDQEQADKRKENAAAETLQDLDKENQQFVFSFCFISFLDCWLFASQPRAFCLFLAF